MRCARGDPWEEASSHSSDYADEEALQTESYHATREVPSCAEQVVACLVQRGELAKILRLAPEL
jgi:hypothetical protein